MRGHAESRAVIEKSQARELRKPRSPRKKASEGTPEAAQSSIKAKHWHALVKRVDSALASVEVLLNYEDWKRSGREEGADVGVLCLEIDSYHVTVCGINLKRYFTFFAVLRNRNRRNRNFLL
jgi:hypothetical protein